MGIQIRQGDILLERTSDKPPKKAQWRARRDGKLIVAEGEATGHHHVIESDTAVILETPDIAYLVVDEPTELTHQEHATLDVPIGTYHIVNQREYVAEEIARRVYD